MGIYNTNILLEEVNILTEGKLSQLTIGFKIKDKQNLTTIFKKHSYPGLVNTVNNCKDLEDLQYLKKDLSVAQNQFKTIRNRIEICNKLGESDKTKNYYKGIKKLYIDNGITTKDVDLTIKWYKEVYAKALNDRIKELRNK